MDAAAGPRGSYSGDQIPKVKRKDQLEGHDKIVYLYVLNDRTNTYELGAELENPTQDEVDRETRKLQLVNRSASATEAIFNPDLYQAKKENKEYKRQIVSGGAKPESKGESPGGDPATSTGKKVVARNNGEVLGGIKPNDFDIKISKYESLKGKEKTDAITKEKADLKRLDDTIIANYTNSNISRAPGFNCLKEYNESQTSLTKSQTESFSLLTKINKNFKKSVACFHALGGYRHKNKLNLQDIKPVIVKGKLNTLASVGIEVANKIIEVFTKDQNNPGIKTDIETLSDFANSLLGHSGDELKLRIAQLREKLEEPTKRAEAAFKLCNDLISDDELNNPRPFRTAGNLRKINQAYKLFTENKTAELREYIKKIMQRDDIIDFAKKVYIENRSKIYKMGCISLETLINRTINQQGENRAYEEVMKRGFPQWYD